MSEDELFDNVSPIDEIRRYRVVMGRRRLADKAFNASVVLIEIATILSVTGRGLRYMSRELDDDDDYPPRSRRIRGHY
jgi:hypothetical protein